MKRYKEGDCVGVQDTPQGPLMGHVKYRLRDGRYRIKGTDGREYVRDESKLNDLRQVAREAARPPKKVKPPTIPAKDVPTYGGFFHKPGGEYVHMRMSEASVKFLKLDESKVYGVAWSGTVSVLDPDKPVVLCTVEALVANVAGNEAWEDTVGVTGRRQHDLIEARALITKALATLEETGGHTVETLNDLRDAVERLEQA